MDLTIDIETVPTQKEALKKLVVEGVSPPGNYKKAETIEKWWKEYGEQEKEDKYRATALNGTYGEITHIGYAFDDEDPQCLYRTLEEPESDVLKAFMDALHNRMRSGRPEPIKWIGHYITGFDLRFIWNRLVINQIKPSIKIPYDVKPWADNVYDTAIEWGGLSKGSTSCRLDEICKAFGYEGKGDIDGSKVWDYMKAGKTEEVAEYCKDDVIKARLLYKRMNFK